MPALVLLQPLHQASSGGDGTYDGTFQSVYSMAQRSGAKFPELVAAQWQLESAGGTALSGTNNFFGIKAAPGESGTVNETTWEEDSSGSAVGHISFIQKL